MCVLFLHRAHDGTEAYVPNGCDGPAVDSQFMRSLAGASQRTTTDDPDERWRDAVDAAREVEQQRHDEGERKYDEP